MLIVLGALPGYSLLVMVIFVWPQLHFRGRQSSVQITLANDRPPVVQKYLDWSPVRDPSANSQAFFDDTTNRTRRKVGGGSLTDDNAEGENREPDGQCATANAKELVEIETEDLGTIAKKTRESRPQLVSPGRRCLSLRQVHDDPEWQV